MADCRLPMIHSLTYMRLAAATVLCLLLSLAACCHGADDAASDRPFAWLSGKSGTTASSLRRALSVPGVKCPAQEMVSGDASRLYLDMAYSFGIKDESAFQAKAYEVLDSLMTAERRLEEGRKSADKDDRRYDAAYSFLRYRLRFAQALAKAEVSRRMAAAGASSYCTQAMESAIDCLKASVEARDQFDKLKAEQGYKQVDDLSSETIRAFREELLRIWHSSKTQGSLAPIRDMDVGRALNEATTSTVREMKTRKKIGGLFAWLGASSAGNHPVPASVE